MENPGKYSGNQLLDEPERPADSATLERVACLVMQRNATDGYSISYGDDVVHEAEFTAVDIEGHQVNLVTRTFHDDPEGAMCQVEVHDTISPGKTELITQFNFFYDQYDVGVEARYYMRVVDLEAQRQLFRTFHDRSEDAIEGFYDTFREEQEAIEEAEDFSQQTGLDIISTMRILCLEQMIATARAL